MYTVTLNSVGNPALGQYVPISESEYVVADDIADLIRVSSDYVQRWNLGAGNWTFPAVYKDGRPLGRLAYNMRIVGLEMLEMSGQEQYERSKFSLDALVPEGFIGPFEGWTTGEDWNG